MTARNLVLNAGAGLAAQVGTTLLALLTLPYIVHRLGDEAYAIFVMLGTVAGYAAVAHVGIGRGLTRVVAGDHAQGDLEAMHRHIGTALAVYLVLGGVAAATLALLSGSLAEEVFNVPLPLQAPTRAAFLITAGGLLVQFPLNVLSAIPAAVQMLRVSSILRSAFWSVSILSTVALLALGSGLVEVALAQVAVNVVAVAAHLQVIRRLVPGLSIKGLRVDRPFVRPFLRESFLVSWGGVMATLSLQLDRLFLGIFLPISQVTPYAVAQNLAAKIWLVPTHVLEAVYPEMSARHALGREAQVRSLYTRGARLVAIAVVPLTLLLLLFADRILTCWMGADLAAAGSGVLRILAAAVLVSSFGWSAVTLAQSSGRPEIPARVQTGQALVNAVGCLLFVPRLGIEGAALAWLLHHVIFIPILVVNVHRELLVLSTSAWLRRCVLPAFLVPSVPVLALIPLRGLMTGAIALVLGIGGGYAASLLVTYFLVLDAAERGAIREIAARLLGRGNLRDQGREAAPGEEEQQEAA